MRRFLALALAGASVAAISAASTPAFAQTVTAAPAEEATLGEIVVTARRRSESLQEVPQTVNAVSGDTLQKLNIQQFQDVQQLVPGLTLNTASNGYGSSASLRGVDFNVNSGASPTTQFYVNDVPIEANSILTALFDVGQVEVLRGPQGTTRGEPAPSGAITLTTHKPNLSEFGGYVDVTASDQRARNVQAAINVPIIQDVLAVRLAGLFDTNKVNGVSSVNSRIEPRSNTSAFRVSTSFEPSDRFNLNVMWQHLDKDLSVYDQVYGPGSPGGVFGFNSALGPITGVTLPANYNGGPIGLSDYASVENRPQTLHQHTDIVTVQADSRVFGQHLSYVGSYAFFKIRQSPNSDPVNLFPGQVLNLGSVFADQQQTTQEIRLSSDPAPGRFFDYVVGGFYNWTSRDGLTIQQASALPGVFGTPASPFNLVDASQIFPLDILVPSALQEYSVFGNVTFHLGSQTELAVGARQLWYMSSNDQQLRLGPPLNIPLADLYRHKLYTPTIYTATLSHHFTRDLMVYFNTGSSWRAGPQEPGITNAKNDPSLNALTFLSPEKSKSYEVGLKSTFWDGRARANVALFHQKFNNFIYSAGNAPYLSCGTATQALDTCTVGHYGFTTNADAVVNGLDFDSALQVTRNWNIAFQASYAHGNLDNARIPCNDGDFNGTPDGIAVNSPAGFVANNEFVAVCNSGQALSARPFWTASIQSEYVHPIRDDIDGFLRTLVTITPGGRHVIQNVEPSPGYNLVNLYAGVRSTDDAWEVSLFARNLLNNQTPTSGYFIGPGNVGVQGLFNATPSGGSGYYGGDSMQVAMTLPREIGINVHYAFGSR